MGFNPKGAWLMYGGADRNEVFVQDGQLFNAKHERLPPDLNHLNKQRYAMNSELRIKVVEQRAEKEYAQKLAALQAEQDAFKRQLLDAHERELAEQGRALEEALLPSIPPHPSLPTVEDIVLTDIERKVLGDELPKIPDEDDELNLDLDLEDDGESLLDPIEEDDAPKPRGTHKHKLEDDVDVAKATGKSKTGTIKITRKKRA